ncbi:beta strand repeat-containing protein [Cereibacter johrii]|uniref:beta strand repeat-containing protein n=1 Tax=Cereibacter johrii TaxID=445629 RepID=UPI000DCBDBDF|nr:autotransporter-associated beta strand repeat-containing protein [Cereibacter johrii]RAZ82095.1 hypothetical protein DDV93_20835 [Cereibacter johrii]
MMLMTTTALAQGADFTRVMQNGQVGAVQNVGVLGAAQAVATGGAGTNKSGFELLSGSATVNGAGATFSNFSTVGSEGSGGGAGLGGVFFVNSNAALTIRDANFVGNSAKGGEGGGGGSVALTDAGFAVADKSLAGTSNFIAGFSSTVSGSAGGPFRIDSLTYGSSAPPYNVLNGSTIAIESTSSPSFARVANSSATGLTFEPGAGLDVTQYVKSAKVAADESAASSDSAAFVDPADVANGSASRINISNLPLADRLALQPGSAIVGSGIPSGTTVTEIVKNAAGEPAYAVFSSPVAQTALSSAGFNVFTPPPLTGSAFTASGNSVQFAEGALSPVLEVGMTVTTPGFPSGTMITAIDRATNTVTFSSTPPANLIKFDASKPGSTVGSNVIFAPTTNTGLKVGDVLSGTGIPPGTTVTAVNGDQITLSAPVTAKVSAITSETLRVTGTTVVTQGSLEGLRVGMVAEGTGVPAGTKITAIDPITKTITLSNGVTGDPSRLNFVSDVAVGGAMNGRAPVLTGSNGTNGNDGIIAFNNGGNGGDGQGGLAGANNAAGTGGSGGNGGDGKDGLSTNPDLIFSASALALDIASAIAEGIGAGVPDPYPKPVLAAAAGLSVASKVVQAADITRQIVVYQTNVDKGLTGTGGGGGDGGDGGSGSEFFGGGVGGAGGNGGAAAGNVLGDGAAGAGGDGGDGGFGAGGGASGQPGAGAAKSAIGSGGSGGFGGGAGSSVDSTGTTSGGQGGSGFGGAIFVRSGGTLVLQGSMTFAGNRAVGGSSADADGSAGEGAGSDLFIMKGADVTISADAGKKIIFEGTIADDSLASISEASNASGAGASIKINGEGQTVFLNRNTYTGDTEIQSGMLVAADGVGIHEDSRIVFAGLPTNDGNGDLQLTGTGVPVLLSAGTFDRWVGSESDQVMWTGSGGFAALESGLTINLGASAVGNQTLVWGQNGFVPNNSSLVLGAVDATGVVTFMNNITTQPGGDVAFYLVDNASTANDFSVLKGSVTADVMTVNANAGAATMKVENNLNVSALQISGGTLETRAGGKIADTASVSISLGATFIAGTVDTVGAVTNAGTYDVNADQEVASLTNSGTVDQDADITAGAGGISNSGSYALGGNITSEGNVTQNGAMTVEGKQRIDVTGATNGLTGSGTIALTAAADGLTVDQDGSTTFSGSISGAGDLIKEGDGKLTLTGSSSFTGGTTVSAGTIDTTGGGQLADTGAISIASGASFVAGTADTVGAVSNSGLYDVNTDQTVASLTNSATGTVDQDADITADAGGVSNAGTYMLGGDITSTGNVEQNGTMTVEGDRRIDVIGDETGLTGTGTIALATAGDALTVDQLGNTTFGGSITGLGDLTKEGSGILTLTGASTFTGGTTVSEGTIDTTGGGTLADTGAISISSGATFIAGTVDTVGAVTNAGTYDVNADQEVASLTNSGTVDQDADITAGAGGISNSGSYALGGNITSEGNVTQNGAMTVEGKQRIDVTGATNGLTGSGTIALTAAADGLTVDQDGSTTFSGSISGAGDLIKEGDGKLTLTGSSSFTGGTTVSAGTIDTTGGGQLADTGAISIASGASFVAGTADTVGAVSNSGLYDVNTDQTVASLTNSATGTVDQDADITADAGGVSNAGTYMLGGDITSTGNVEQNGTMTVEGDRRIDVIGDETGLTGTGTIALATAGDALTVDQLGNTTFGGSITGLGDLTKEGSGILTLTGEQNSVNVGAFTVNGGGVALSFGGILASDTNLALNGAHFDIASGAQTLNSLTGSGQVALHGSDLTLRNNSSFAGTIADAGRLKVSGTLDIDGALSGAILDLDSGKIELANESSAGFNDVTLQDAELIVHAPPPDGADPRLQVAGTLSVSGCSLLRVNGQAVPERAALRAGRMEFTGACAVLAGTGYIDVGSVTFTDGAVINPGQSPGILIFSGDLTLENSVTQMEVGGIRPGMDHDVIQVLGRFVIGDNAILNVTNINGFVPMAGQSFKLFDFDPTLLEGDFAGFANQSGENYVYSRSTGVLVSLGSQSSGNADQGTDLARDLSTLNGETNGEMSAVLDQLIKQGTQETANVGSVFGGNLVPALTTAAPEARQAIFARFTPEGYASAYEYAYRSLGFGRNIVDEVDLSKGSRFFGDAAIFSGGIKSSSSGTLSDYSMDYSGVSVMGGMQTDRLAFGFRLSDVDGSAKVGSVGKGDGSGRNVELGAVFQVFDTDSRRLQLYATYQSGRHDLDGTRSAISSTTSFSGVTSEANVLRFGAQYMWDIGRTTITLDAGLMRGKVGALSFAETGGDLNDRLTVNVPERDVTGGSLAVSAQTRVTDAISVMAGLDVDVTRGLEDYTIASSVGTEDFTVNTTVPGIDPVLANLTLGVSYMFTPQARLSASAYAIGLGSSDAQPGASLKLDFSF